MARRKRSVTSEGSPDAWETNEIEIEDDVEESSVDQYEEILETNEPDDSSPEVIAEEFSEPTVTADISSEEIELVEESSELPVTDNKLIAKEGKPIRVKAKRKPPKNRLKFVR